MIVLDFSIMKPSLGASSLDNDEPPSYSESLQPRPQATSPFLPTNVSSARSFQISNLLQYHILPRLHSNVLAGFSRSTLLLIPSNVSNLQSKSDSTSKESTDTRSFPGEKVVDFPSTDDISLVRLDGTENTLEFWRQPAVLKELDQQLRTTFQQEGHRIIEHGEDAEQFQKKEDSTVRKTVAKRKPSSVEWRTKQETLLEHGDASVEVEMREICLRIENEMGLYETRTGKAIVVRIEIGVQDSSA